jgi:transposase
VTSRGKTLLLRRIGYRDAETGKRYEFLTNHFRLSAKTIANVYKDRWQIEIFFRELKQNLRIKSFVGNTENAVLIQIYTYLTVYLLLAYQKFLSKIGISVQLIFQIVSLNLLGTDSLDELLNPRQRKPENPYTLACYVSQLSRAAMKKPVAASAATHPGVYCLRTNELSLDAETLWRTYIMLTDLEAVFRCLKSELGLWPIYHSTEIRSGGHIFITVLACQCVHAHYAAN